MTLDFSHVTNIVIPEGNVTKIESGSVTLWQKVAELIKEWFGYPIQTAYSLAGNLINWKLYGNSKQSILPDGYTQLEYLETDGNSCINTNLMITGNESWECVFQNAGSSILSTPVLGTLNGGSYFTNVNNFSITYTTAISPGAYSVYLDGNNGDSQHSWNGGVLTDHTIQTIKYTGLNIAPTINDVAMAQLSPTTLVAITPSVGVRLFGRATTAGNGALSQAGVRIYSFKGDSWNFIPAKRNSDNVLGMYDTVTNTFFTNAGTGTFIAGNVTPSPSAPVEVTSVGDLELPSGYTQLESITFPSGAYIDTGIIPTTFDYQIYFKGSFGVTTGGPNCAWGFMTASTIPRWLCASWTNQYLLNANTTNGFGEADTNTHEFLAEVYNKDGDDWYKATLDGVLQQEFNLYPSTGGFSGNTLSIYLGARHNASGVGNYGLITAKAFWVKKAGVLIANYIPAKNSSNVIGMYDLVTNQFFTNAGTGTFTAGSVVAQYKVPINDNGTLQQTIYLTRPLAKVSTYADYIDYENQQVVRNVGVKVFDGTESWSNQATNSVRLQTSITDLLPQGSWAVLHNGLSSHYNVTPAYDAQGSVGCIGWYTYSNAMRIIANYTGGDATAFKAFLAQQYANGTPVTIYYVLATPTYESITVPALTMEVGSNIITSGTSLAPSDMYCRGRVSQL